MITNPREAEELKIAMESVEEHKDMKRRLNDPCKSHPSKPEINSVLQLVEGGRGEMLWYEST